MKKVISIPPRWDYIICLILGAIVTLGMMLGGIESDTPIRTNADRMIFIGAAMVFFARWYVLYEDCLVLKFLFIPVRKIPWTRVWGAFYLPAAMQKQKNAMPTVVLMLDTLGAADIPKPEQAADFVKKHGRHLVRLQLPPFNREMYLEAIEYCVGPIHHFDTKKEGSS